MAERHQPAMMDVRSLLQNASVKDDFWTEAGFLTKDRRTIAELHKLKKAAESDYDLLVYGRTGTGKEIAARIAHQYSPRAEKPCITIDCTNLPETLAEAILFGHMPNSFTGAGGITKRGLCDAAQGGVIFFDEISKLPLGIQPKLLRLLENRTFLRVGGDREIKADFQIIAATNQELMDLIARGLFLKDLYYRMGITVTLPSLRDRREDIGLLTNHFLRQENALHGKKEMSPEAIEILWGHAWPGNVRELKNVIRRGHLNCDDCFITPRHLEISSGESDFFRGEYILLPAMAKDVQPMVEIERNYIASTVKACGGNRQEAARRLKIGPATLYRKMALYGLRDTPSSNSDSSAFMNRRSDSSDPGINSKSPEEPPKFVPWNDGFTHEEAAYIRNLMEAVSKIYRVTPEDMRGKNRHRTVAEARYIAIYIFMLDGFITRSQIAQAVSRRNMSYLYYAYESVQRSKDTNVDMTERLNAIQTMRKPPPKRA